MKTLKTTTMTCIALALLTACAGHDPVQSDPRIVPASSAPARPTGTAWREADALFRQSVNWRGSDAAYSIALNDERVLWLFGDTFVSTGDGPRRDQGTMISNTIGIQHGLDPTTADIHFYWRETSSGPQAFLPDDPDVRYWPMHGVAFDDAILVFWMRVAPSDEGLGFAIEGTRATRIERVGGDPLAWPIHDLDLELPLELEVGSMGVVRHDDWVYALSTTGGPPFHAYLVRWSVADAARGDLAGASWWSDDGWSDERPPRALFDDAAPEGSLHFDPTRELWISVQSTGFGGTDLDLRTAPAPEGPWSPRRTFFRPPESDRRDLFVYAGKAHPELVADGLAVTYAHNAFEFEELLRDESLYWPRFVQVTWTSAPMEADRSIQARKH